jgi:23S rRNA (adenine-N6)-dimethyltransferase
VTSHAAVAASGAVEDATVAACQGCVRWCVAVGRRRRTSRDQRRRTHQQNFLTDRAIVERLVADVVPGDLVVDLGAGNGALTLPAVAAGADVLAIERDPAWSARLRERARAAGLHTRVRVVCGDLLTASLPTGAWRVIASPPYGLTTTLLHRLLDDPTRAPERLDLILQWEVARKFAAQPPTTLLATTWAPWWQMTLVQRVPRTAFRPVPRVDSGWLRIRRRTPDVLATHLAPAWEAFLRDRWPISPPHDASR